MECQTFDNAVHFFIEPEMPPDIHYWMANEIEYQLVFEETCLCNFDRKHGAVKTEIWSV